MMYTNLVNDDFVHDSNYKRIYIKPIMNYEQKYKEALEKAKELYNNEGCRPVDLGVIFPELREGEDEWIRKRLIQALHGDVLNIRETYIAIAWLEKQGKPKEIDYDEELKKL